MDNEKQIFIDENGVKHEFEIIDTFKVEETEYAILQSDDNEEALLLRFDKDENDEIVLSVIEDPEEFDEVRDLYFELQEEQEEQE